MTVFIFKEDFIGMGEPNYRLGDITATNDCAFKKLFGTEENKDIMIEFVSLVTGIDKADFKEAELGNTEISSRFSYGKRVRLDIKITLKNGDKIDVEMQNAYFNYYPKRSICYWAEMLLENFNQGAEYPDLNRCIVITLLNAPFPLANKLHSEYKILDTEAHTVLDPIFEMHFFDLTKLEESVTHEKLTEIEKWLLFIKTHNNDIRTDLALGNPAMAKANEALNAFYLTNEARAAYVAEGHRQSEEASIRSEGRKEGMEKGLAMGMQKGIEKGMQKGIEKGSYDAKIEMAKNLIKMGISIEDICKATGLNKEEILTL